MLAGRAGAPQKVRAAGTKGFGAMNVHALNEAAITLSDFAGKTWLRALTATAPIANEPDRTLPARIEELALVHGNAPALLGENECLSYSALAERANRYARWAIELGVGRGETVCLLMPNRPEYVAIWLGVSRVGGTVALLNTSLTGAALAHCVNLAAPQHIIVAAELLAAFESARPHLAREPRTWLHGTDHASFPRIDRAIARQSGAPLQGSERGQSSSRTGRCSSIRRAPPGCRRPPTSATSAFCCGAIGSPA